jgi:hypothetical protein
VSFRNTTPAQGVVNPFHPGAPGAGVDEVTPLDVVPYGGLLVASVASTGGTMGLLANPAPMLVRAHSIVTTDDSHNTFLYDSPTGPTRIRAFMPVGIAFLALDGLLLTGAIYMASGTTTGSFVLNYDLVASPQIQ